MQKHCPKCDQDKPLTPDFWLPRKDSKDGYRGICRLCFYAQQRPNKRRHYQRHAGRIRAERREWRQRNPEQKRLADLRYYLKHRERRIAYNRHYYWQNHDRLLAHKRWYGKHVRPLRIQFGDLPTDHIDMEMWQRQQDRQQAQQVAVAILTLTMQALTEDERHFLLAFESAEYNLDSTAQRLGLSLTEAVATMQRIREVTKRAMEATKCQPA